MIIIERDAVLCLMNREGPSISLPEILSELPKTLTSSTASSPSATTDDRIRNPLTPAPRVILRGSAPISLPDLCPVELVPCSDDEESDLEDDASCATVSTSSLSGDRRQGVTWSTHLVTEVKTRPRTLPEDVRDLFYTYEETQRFRQEYRQERKMLAQLQAEPCLTTSTCTNPASLSTPSSTPFSYSSTPGRHRISRVVVMHNDTLKTFFDDDLLSPKVPPSTEDHEKDTLEHSPALLPCGKSNDFFDDDSFWSGSITWY